MKNLLSLLIAIAAVVGTPILSSASSTLYVNDDVPANALTGKNCNKPNYNSVQAAVTAASPGDQIIVCAGTYTEQVSINKSLGLRGDGAVVIKAPSLSTGPIIGATAAGTVNISKLTVDGGSTMTGSPTGIRYDGTDGEINSVAVLNVRDAAGSSGAGIRIQTLAGPMANVRVLHSLIINSVRAGIVANGSGVTAEIAYNQVVGPVSPVVGAPNAIQVSRGAVGQVHHNDVRKSVFPGPPGGGVASGVILFCSGPTSVDHNTVLDADLGISLVDNTNADVNFNQVSGSGFEGYSVESGNATFFGDPSGAFGGPVTCPGGLAPVTSNNTLTDNTASNSGDSGVAVYSDCPTTSPCGLVVVPGPINNVVRNTHVESSAGDGIHVYDGANNLFDGNHIRTSTGVDAADDTIGAGTAGTANIWQKNHCASSIPAGLCE